MPPLRRATGLSTSGASLTASVSAKSTQRISMGLSMEPHCASRRGGKPHASSSATSPATCWSGTGRLEGFCAVSGSTRRHACCHWVRRLPKSAPRPSSSTGSTTIIKRIASQLALMRARFALCSGTLMHRRSARLASLAKYLLLNVVLVRKQRTSPSLTSTSSRSSMTGTRSCCWKQAVRSLYARYSHRRIPSGPTMRTFLPSGLRH
mmetsp:Transcript_22519/g.68642  ORF Transcript_22519/g.68642 Transcript_22519/m.68642 type:complete len:207 (+) Transcript_22519:1040-1660(+)